MTRSKYTFARFRRPVIWSVAAYGGPRVQERFSIARTARDAEQGLWQRMPGFSVQTVGVNIRHGGHYRYIDCRIW